MTLAADALGQVIRDLREQTVPPLSQEQLGQAAGYGAGAGVSISRVEGGLTRPSAARFAGIALALGVTPEQLQDLADARAEAQRDLELSDLTSARTSGARRRATRERLTEVQHRVTERTELIRTEGELFNVAHDRAREAFAEPLLALTGRIVNAPTEPSERLLTSGTSAEPTGGTAVTAIERHADNDLASRTGENRRFGRAQVLTLMGLSVAPAGLLAAGGLVWLNRRRNKREEDELRRQLADVEAGLNSSQPGFDALADLLPRMTLLLDYIAVHAAHALGRWEQNLPTRPVEFRDLSAAQAEKFQDLLTIASCHGAVDGIDVGALLTCNPATVADLATMANQTLERASQVVHQLV